MLHLSVIYSVEFLNDTKSLIFGHFTVCRLHSHFLVKMVFFHAVLGSSRSTNPSRCIFLPQTNAHECFIINNYLLTSWFTQCPTVQCSGPWPRWSTSMFQFLCPFLSPSENAQTKTTFSLLFAHHFVLLRISLKS